MEITKKHMTTPSLIDSEFQNFMLNEAPKAEGFWEFYQALSRHFPLRDWLHRPIRDFYGAVRDFHQFLSERDGPDPLARVYTPSVDEQGWLCGRTVVLLSCNDLPFLVDSVRMVIEQQGYSLHVSKSTVLGVQRASGQIESIVTSDSLETQNSVTRETFLYMEISLISTPEERDELKQAVLTAVEHCHQVVNDYPQMQERLAETIVELSGIEGSDEARDFLLWLTDSNFTFLGYRDFDLSVPIDGAKISPDSVLSENDENKLGIFVAVGSKAVTLKAANFLKGDVDFFSGRDIIYFSKSRTRCTVHRSVYPDYVAVKKYDSNGRVVGERRFLGLYTYSASSKSPAMIPILRQKVRELEKRFGILPSSHDGKRLARLIDIHPKEELFQSSNDELYDCFAKIAELDERDIVSLNLRQDPFGRFVSCLIYIPREHYTTDLRQKIQKLIGQSLHTQDVDSTTFFSESKHARAYIVFRLSEKEPSFVDVDVLEQEIAELTLGWKRRFDKSLQLQFGESKGTELFRKYASGLPQGYQESFDVISALKDVETFESLKEQDAIALSLYKAPNSGKDQLKFRILKLDDMIELSDVIPILENMGLRVLGEEPYKIERSDGQKFWIHDFQLKLSSQNIEHEFTHIKVAFEEAFEQIWRGQSESDSFNRLILAIGINWREVNLLRAYANYMKQTLFHLSPDYIADTLFAYPKISKNILKLFYGKFDPKVKAAISDRESDFSKLQKSIEESLEDIKVLNQDKVFRRYLDLISATSRVSFFQKDKHGQCKSSITLKLQPSLVADIPEPKPAFEFFVYSARVEGVHLRTSKVARGGLRWSDRQEDYRTEVLGLVKAQQVKNAVIVPSGAKGGFFAKRLPSDSKAKFFAEGVECYKIFIRGLLDLTDNLLDSEVVRPIDVVCYDGDDPYLVVAADKGTATFSDIANEISIEKGHWLGDAFASGGSQGYDHKAMGITAKGAWVSVQRHFRELGVHTQNDPFSVLAVGDMGGDVFGNGMLCSDKIKLVAAFNHLHIFIDPDPDPSGSFAERQRLFTGAGSGWLDYDSKLISEGGGVFSRSDKFISLNSQIKKLVATQKTKVTPDELINLLLKAPIDLVWNGGIGTYVKSTEEQNSEVGDRANDNVRVNGSELRCKIFGEGGNLGMTQRGRVEFCLNGGACNTDFIDNSAGVDCSDHEVNIKILIDEKLGNGDLTEKQRNKLLVDMTESVSDLVLANNYKQTLLLSMAESEALKRTNEYRRFIDYLENLERLDRSLEFLPSDSELMERMTRGESLTRPELSVLMSYAKVQLKEELSESGVSDDPQAADAIYKIFPENLHRSYRDDIQDHKLRKEIIGTQLANGFINDLGITSYYRLSESTSRSAEEIALAYVVARTVFQLDEFQHSVSQLDYEIPSTEQHKLLLGMTRRVRRATSWFLKNRRRGIDVGLEVSAFREPLASVQKLAGELTENKERNDEWKMRVERYSSVGIDSRWYNALAMPDNLYSGLSVVEVHNVSHASLEESVTMFYQLMDVLRLNWFANLLSEIKVDTFWQASAREAYIDDLESQLRTLTVALLKSVKGDSVLEKISFWSRENASLIARWEQMVRRVESSPTVDFAMCSVALRELAELVKASVD